MFTESGQFFTSGGGYEIDQSIRFNDNDNAYLIRTNTATPTSTTIWTCSFWVKRATLGTDQYILNAGPFNSGNDFEGFYFMANDTLRVQLTISNSQISDYRTNAVFRDPSAWYHFVIVRNGQSYVVYVNGVAQTFGTSTFGSNPASYVNAATPHEIGNRLDGLQDLDSYLAEFNCVDGQALAPTSFGETNDDGVWIPKAYAGAYGNNGFYITGATAGDLGEDFSGNGNDFTSSGLAANDQVTDTPTENYATYLPLYGAVSHMATFSNGNLTAAGSGVTGRAALASIGPTTGKFYSEFTLDAVGTAVLCRAGVVAVDNLYDPLMFSSGEFAPQINSVYYFANGTRRLNNSDTASWGSTFTTGDVIGVAYDADTGKIWFAKNNTWQSSGDPAAGSNPAATLTTGTPFYFNNHIFNNTWTADFGQSGFEYTPPTGFLALSTSSLLKPVITDGSKYFHSQLYTGTGSSGLAVTNDANAGDFQPDLLWIAPRSNGDNHVFWDVVRGTTKRLKSNSADAQDTDSPAQVTFESDGFDLDTTDANFNGSSRTYVAWQWKTQGAAGSSNTDGSINTTTTSVNTTAGISLSTYTGTGSNATVGHGLGVKPSMVIVKVLSGADNWQVYHEAIGATKYLQLNTTIAAGTASVIWNNTEPTATLISLGNGSGVNQSSATFVAYAFAEVEAFSRFGIYNGNGSTDGSFIYTGFKPAFVMVKRTDSADNWAIYDAARDPINVAEKYLYADTNNTEATFSTAKVDFLSNGFKWRGAVNFGNNSGGTYIYMAWAEHPFANPDGAPATAR